MLLPKVELHLHLEGAAPPSLIKQLAARNNVTIDQQIYKNDEEFAWNDFLHFLHAYEEASRSIRVPRDYYDITYQYLKQSALEGTIYCELNYSPEHAERASGIPSHEHLVAIQQATDDAERDFNIICRILISCVRHYGVESTIKVARYTTTESIPCVVGFTMGGDEINYPPHLFKEAFDIAHAAGIPCTAHAGEWAGPESVVSAINDLRITRVGHGVRAIENPQVLAMLKDQDIVLEVCPGSNLALGLYPDYQHHPLKQIMAAGVKVTLNSDDPPYFATTIGKEYDNAIRHFGLTEAELLEITKTGIDASFADHATKQRLHQRVREYAEIAK